MKWGKGTAAYRDTKSAVVDNLPDETSASLQQTAIAVFQALELRDYARIDMRLRPDGSIVPRNGFMQPKQNKTDFRVLQRIPLGGRMSIDVIGDVFNVFNNENYTLVTQEVAANFNKPASGQFRTAQFGFRFQF